MITLFLSGFLAGAFVALAKRFLEDSKKAILESLSMS